MKKIFLLCFVFSQAYTADYSLVLLGKDKDHEYCFSKIKLDDLKKSPEVNEPKEFIKLMDSSHLLRLLKYSVYSAELNLEKDVYTVDIDPKEPRNCFYQINDKLHPLPTTRFSRILVKILMPILDTYHRNFDTKEKDTAIDNDLVKHLTQIVGQEKFSLLFKSTPDVEFYCACIIEDYELYDCITSYVFDYHITV